MNRRTRRAMVNRIAGELNLASTATHQEAARRVCELMGEHLGKHVEVRFAPLPDARLTGVSALLANGNYLVICADSPRWYHRLQILLHEFAHLMLGHQPVTLTKSESLRRLAPNLLPDMARYVAGRTSFSDREERAAEELADELLEVITDQRTMDDTRMPGHVRRILASFAHADEGAHDVYI
jgi:IrrE N-terminal-like domain